MKKIGKTCKMPLSPKCTLTSWFRGGQSHSLPACMWSYTSKMFLSVYLSKMLIWDNQFLTKQADIFLQIHLIRDIHMKFNGGFYSNSIPGSPDYVLTFSFANQQRYACIMLLQMNTETGFKMFSKLTENIYLANTYFLFLFSLPI